MYRFSTEDVRQILSGIHRLNTAIAHRKRPEQVTADELIEHWLRYEHAEVVHFNVGDAFFEADEYGDQGGTHAA